ncbi:histidine phosphatase family protein [Dictyobacter kobayashii]|uniref:Alpha-ribazole phosphatase n=1 Tax=Dictyobacter kobayashii TaxID=2014872 RepID=A0A402AKM2_9CHLR|nr:histidine phosphatase family protein [Dictyobacter kobayashii]GCE19560.1 alpha-ribazole phosphatase [Dictyobacter kobayashii]
MAATTRLLFVRHGETLANRDFRYIGTRDDALSEHGLLQARQLAQTLAILPVAAVYSSPLQRARQTALPIAEQHQLSVQTIDDLREGNFGTWEGLSRAEVMARSPQDEQQLLAWEQDPTQSPPQGESFGLVQQRVCSAIMQLVQRHPGQTLVLVSHVGPIKVFLCHALDAPLTSLSRFFLDPATISVVDWKNSPLVRLVNSHTHPGWEQARWLQFATI